MKKYITGAFLSLSILLGAAMILPVQAQSLLPDQIGDIFGLLGEEGIGASGFVTSRIQLGLVLALGAVVLIAVVYAIMAAIKYIQSQGDAGKIEEAQKAIQAIFFGIGAMLIAIVGIVLVFVFFGANRPDPALYQVCLSAPNSEGCRSCTGEVDDSQALCNSCEALYQAATDPDDITEPDCIDPITN
ncbi:MAG: hypothetical protein TR69_WS6001000805 [candidate division WS6 bacterium OLB20]|uniref:Uncharacterized protein n=1 Tax=candidate division WS6 bacterium OLB20 TaxID=1617426 RepID=A0A136LYN8_9BACT|nr:MAG: hypothetical protein TR69_WS6001000805 [candidate division WS6 bacterium OLB20]